jgi:hypothetical protein
MKPKKVNLPSIYDEKQFEKAGWRLNKVYLAVLVLVLLLVLRFLNLSLWWFVNKWELTHNTATKAVLYSFLNLASYDAAEKELRKIAQPVPGKPGIAVVAYFNFLHPVVFLVQNNKPGGLSPVDLGRLVLPVEPGRTALTVSLSEVVEKKSPRSKRTQSRHFGSSLLAKLFISPPSPAAIQQVSYILKSPEKSSYLKIPYFVYFFVPMVLVLVLAGFYTRAVWAAYFYFPLMFLLFDFRELFFRVPFHFFIRWFKSDFFNSLELVIAIFLVILFTAAGVIGLMNWKERRDKFAETLIVFLFLLLPIFLRF